MEINGVSETYINGLPRLILRAQHNFRIYHRNYAHRKKAQNHSCNHFLSLYFIKQDSGQGSKHNCDYSGNHCRHTDSRQTINAPVGNQNQAYFTRHRPQNNAEIQAHSAQNRQNQRNDQNRVSADARYGFRQNIAGVLA